MSFLAKIPRTRIAASLPTLALLLAATVGRTQVTSDAQLAFYNSNGSVISMNTPRGVAVAPDGTVYVADVGTSTVAGQVYRISSTGIVGGTSGTTGYLPSTVTTLAIKVGGTAVNLKKPNAVAVDSNGDLYIADAGLGEVLELTAPEAAGTLTATTVTYPGTDPIALAVDSQNYLYIADTHSIYKVKGTTETALPLGSTTGYTPLGLAVDTNFDVFFADASNIIYESVGGTSAATSFLADPATGTFEFSSASTKPPIGMGFDPAGNLYVLDASAASLWEIYAGTETSVQVPITSAITNPASLAVSAAGNLYYTDDAATPAVNEVYYNNNPVNFGPVPAGKASPLAYVNFFFNSGDSGLSTYENVQGDVTTELSQIGGTVCSTGSLGTQGAECTAQVEANYLATNPGLRGGVWGLVDGFGNRYTVPVVGISEAADLALYPGNLVNVNGTTLYEPQGLAVTGNGGTLFVADEGGQFTSSSPTYAHGKVWAYAGGAGTPVPVGGFTTPMGLAVDAAGDLFVADYIGTVTEIKASVSGNTVTWPGFGTTLTFPTSAALTHPMSLAFDPSGNLYIGDMGSAGSGANAGSPGYIVKVPANGGTPVKLNYTIGGAPVIFPEALATDTYGNLFIADGGDGQTNMGQVDVVTAATQSISAVTFSAGGNPLSLSEPSGLAIDAANDLYVLDGFNERILVAPIAYSGTTPTVTGTEVTLLGGGKSGMTGLITPASLVVWPNGQYITVADIGLQDPTDGTVDPVQLLTLQSTNSTVNGGTGSSSVSGVNVGNEPADFGAVKQTGSTSYSLSGCGSGTGSGTGTLLAMGVANTCTSTITYNAGGSGTGETIFTLQGTTASDYSGLGNEIIVAVPVAQFVWNGPTDGTTQTGTVTNTGGGILNISNLTSTTILFGGANFIAGTTCSTTTSLSAGQSCTIAIDFTSVFGDYDQITVTDNSNGVPNQTQSQDVAYSVFLATPVGGPGLGGGTLSKPGSDQPQTGIPHTALDPHGVSSAPVEQQGISAASDGTGRSSDVVQQSSTVQVNNSVPPPNVVVPLGFSNPNSNDSNASDPNANNGGNNNTSDATSGAADGQNTAASQNTGDSQNSTNDSTKDKQPAGVTDTDKTVKKPEATSSNN